jgi:hypothetical protein
VVYAAQKQRVFELTGRALTVTEPASAKDDEEDGEADPAAAAGEPL